MIGLMRRVFNRRENVLAFKVRIILQNFLVGSVCAQKLQHIRDPDSHSANARPPTTLARLDGDALQQLSFHCAFILSLILTGNKRLISSLWVKAINKPNVGQFALTQLVHKRSFNSESGNITQTMKAIALIFGILVTALGLVPLGWCLGRHDKAHLAINSTATRLTNVVTAKLAAEIL